MSKIDLEAVWTNFSEGRVDAVATTLGTNNKLAIEAVGNQLVNDSDKFLGGIWRYSFDVLAVAFLLSLVVVFVFVARQSFPHGKSNQVVVKAAAGIPKYHVITDKDIDRRIVKTIDGSLGDTGQAIGHYAVEPITSGATIHSSQLSSGTVPAAALQGREILLLPAWGPPFQAKDLPALVSLYLSPKRSDEKHLPSPTVIPAAYVLSSGGAANLTWLAVALTPADAKTVSGLLASSEVYTSQNVP